MNPELIKALAVMAALYGRSDINEDGARMLAEDLSEFPTDEVLKALKLCRRELTRFPTVADILSRIDDGHPGVEEAWALVPKDERESAVWTDEMAQAWGLVRTLYDEDQIAARASFKEIYGRLLKDARYCKRRPKWTPSLGLDKSLHEGALKNAEARGLLEASHAAALLPGPLGQSSNGSGLDGIGQVINTVLSNATPQQRAKYLAAKIQDPSEEEIKKRREEFKRQLSEGENDSL